MSGSAMSAHFNLSRGAASQWLRRNGYVISKELKFKFKSEALQKRSTATDYEEFFICCCYLHIPVKQMALMLNRSGMFIITTLRKLKLKIPKSIIEERKLNSRFKPAHIPFNKGMKQTEFMSAEKIERTKATRFYKGQPNHNELHDGAITIRHYSKKRDSIPHKYIRIGKSKWKELQIHNWEKLNGPVPKGYVLACIDGDTLNCHPSNWKLISMKDNMLRNSGSLRLTDGYVARTLIGRKGDKNIIPELVKHPDLIKAKRNALLLNRKINQHAQQVI